MTEKTIIPNNHHKVAYAEAFPNVAYNKMKKTGKCFVYNKHKPLDPPVAEIDDKSAPLNKLIVNGKVVYKGTLKNCLKYINDQL